MSELCVKIPGLDYERDLLSNDNRLFDLRKTQVNMWFSQRLVGACVATPRLADGHHPLTHEKDYP
jgi:hypothetical protein